MEHPDDIVTRLERARCVLERVFYTNSCLSKMDMCEGAAEALNLLYAKGIVFSAAFYAQEPLFDAYQKAFDAWFMNGCHGPKPERPRAVPRANYIPPQP